MENYFTGATQDERWKNDLLNEIRTMNQLMTQIITNNAQVDDKKVVIRPTKERKVATNGHTNRMAKG